MALLQQLFNSGYDFNEIINSYDNIKTIVDNYTKQELIDNINNLKTIKATQELEKYKVFTSKYMTQHYGDNPTLLALIQRVTKVECYFDDYNNCDDEETGMQNYSIWVDNFKLTCQYQILRDSDYYSFEVIDNGQKKYLTKLEFYEDDTCISSKKVYTTDGILITNFLNDFKPVNNSQLLTLFIDLICSYWYYHPSNKAEQFMKCMTDFIDSVDYHDEPNDELIKYAGKIN